MTPEQLETELQKAKSDMDTVLQQLASGASEPERDILVRRYNDLRVQAARIRQELARLTGEEYAILLDIGVVPEYAISRPILFQTDRHCILLFNVHSPDVNDQESQAIIQFDGVSKTQFGLPNDEALDGHPLSKRGLDTYDVFEVLNSQWLLQEKARNQVCFPNFELDCRHFIFTFHDSSFECLAKGFSVNIDSRPFAEIWAELFDLTHEA